jgi:hypothetical protein
MVLHPRRLPSLYWLPWKSEASLLRISQSKRNRSLTFLKTIVRKQIIYINVLMMEAVRTSETLVNFNVTTRRYIPEDSKLQIIFHFTGLFGLSTEGKNMDWACLRTGWCGAYLEEREIKLCDKGFHNLYSSQSIISVIKLRRMRWAGHLASTEEFRNVYTLLVGIPQGIIPLWRSRRGWKDNINADLKEIWCEDVDWIQLAWGRIQCWATVSMLMNLPVQ